MKCPICKGTGELEMPADKERKAKELMVVALLKEGFGLRETGRLVGFTPAYVMKLRDKYGIAKSEHTSRKIG